MNHSQYTQYFRELARRHKQIGHMEGQQTHFARVILSKDEFGQDNIEEFIQSLRSKLKMPFLLLIAYDHQYQDNRSDNKKKMHMGAFIILDRPKEGDFAGEEEILDRTEKIGEDILAFMAKDFAVNLNKYQLFLEECGGEKIKVDQYLGTRFHFAYTQTANANLYHKPDNWID